MLVQVKEEKRHESITTLGALGTMLDNELYMDDWHR